jgi:hypothetical protein
VGPANPVNVVTAPTDVDRDQDTTRKVHLEDPDREGTAWCGSPTRGIYRDDLDVFDDVDCAMCHALLLERHGLSS